MRLCAPIFILLTMLAGCGGGSTASPPPPPPAPTITSVSVSPTNVSVEIGATQQFSATVQGTGNFNPGVTWLVNGTGGGNATFGTINGMGFYMAPSAVPSPAMVTVTAQSVSDPTKIGTSNTRVVRAAPAASWERTGPPGGTIRALAELPGSLGVVFAGGDEGGLWKSTDAGVTWNQILTNTPIDVAAISEIATTSAGPIYVATFSTSGVFKSTDGGLTWTQSQPSPSFGVAGMVVDPQNSSVLYASTQFGGMFKSTDGAAKWTQVTSAPVSDAILHHPIQIDPTQPSILYYGTHQGLYISSDAGNSWTLSSTGIAPEDTDIRDIAIDPRDPTRLFLQAGRPNITVGGFYESTDRGVTWVLRNCCPAGERIVLSPSDPDTIYLYQITFPGVVKSTDGGVSWVNSDSGMPTGSPQQFVVLTGPTGTMASLSIPNAMLATIGGAGVYRSQDAGQNWVRSDAGISAHFGLDVAVDPSSPATVYLAASNGGGFFKSTDAGVMWTNLRVGAAHAIAVDPFDPNHLLGAAVGEGLLESTDSGVTWQQVTNLPPPPSGTAFIRAIFFDPAARGTVFICTQGGGTGIVRSTDGGATYAFANSGLTPLAIGNVRAMANDPSAPGVLYIATEDGIFKSTDNGGTWVSKSTGLPNGQFDRLIGSIAVDTRSTPPIVYAGSLSTKLYKSGNGGDSWTQVAIGIQGLAGFLIVAADPSAVDSIFISAFSGPVTAAWSPDGGITWRPLGSGLGQVLFSERMVIAQTSPQVLLIPSPSNSVLRLVIGP